MQINDESTNIGKIKKQEVENDDKTHEKEDEEEEDGDDLEAWSQVSERDDKERAEYLSLSPVRDD